MTPALILDCDGVLADTELDGHLVALNQAFADVGIATRWSREEYARLPRVEGGKERLQALFTPDNLCRDPGLPRTPEGQARLVERLHACKTEFFVGLVESGRLPGRPGVRRIVESAVAEGWVLAVASAGTERRVRAVLLSVVGAQNALAFDVVLAGDVVDRKKPAPDIYLLALDRLGLPVEDVLVVEDSSSGTQAASAAGLAHIVTVSALTAEQTFPDAAFVVTSLGDERNDATVLASRLDPAPAARIQIADLRRSLSVRPRRR